ncbi:MAG: threonine-phosphate decarboxylase [Deltaproteobacteria bacterium]|nr:threonine-phosphate decarboxylase [Deltaproteobacteria bacterium]
MIQQHGGNLREISKACGIPEEEILDFSASINPLGPPKGALKAILDGMDRLVHYPEIDGMTLRERLAGEGNLSVENVLVGNGSSEFVYLVPRVLSPRRALVPVPSFSDYGRALRLAGCGVVSFPLIAEESFRLDPGRLIDALSEKIDLLVLCNPNNPTGGLLSAEEVLMVVDAAADRGIIVLCDEAFIDFVPDGSVRHRVKEFPNLLVLRSFTKFYGIPGLRAGAIYGDGVLVRRIGACQEPWTMNRLAGAAVAAALDDAEYRERTLELIDAERAVLVGRLASLPGVRVFPSSANFLLLETSSPMPEPDRLFGALLRAGILVRNCASFSGLGPRFFRIAIRSSEENGLLLETFQAVVRRFV